MDTETRGRESRPIGGDSDTPRVLPWLCPEHPEASVRHTWDRTRMEVNWGPNRPRNLIRHTDSNHRYECAECGTELAPPAEAEATR